MSGQKLKSRIELVKLVLDLGKPMVAAELGVAEGGLSREFLSLGITKLYMVDTWTHLEQTGDGFQPQEWHNKNYHAAIWNTYEWREKITILKGLSWGMAQNVPNESLGLLYIDACHTYECVKQDLNAWFDKVVPGGVIAGHDYGNPAYGVKAAVEEFCSGRFDVTEIPEHGDDSSFYFIKTCL